MAEPLSPLRRASSQSTLLRGLAVAGIALAGLREPVVAADSADFASAETDAILQEVVVTATRRAENLSRVPESIAVFDAASLDARGIRSAADLAAVAPGVDLKTQIGIQTNISIRGISNTTGQQTTGAATTGIYLDDTPVQIRSIGNGPGDPLPDIFDLDRVEVLRGPQGTLFGSGSEGGTIRFVAVEPNLHDRSGYERAELGFTHNGGVSYEAGIAEGGPILDGVLGFRISAHYRHDGGFVDRTPYPDGAGPTPAEANANYADTHSVRAALLWSPVEGLKITPSVYFRQTNINDSGVPWVMLSDFSSERYVSGNGQTSPDSNRSSLASVKVDWTRDAFELISNTSYYDRRESNLSDYRLLITNTFGPITGQSPFPVFSTPGYYDNGQINNTQTDWTEELRIQSTNPDARLTWIGGIFAADNRQLNYQNNRTPFLDLETGVSGAATTYFGLPLLDGQYLNVEQIVTHDKQLAAFGEVNLKLTSKLRLTVGLRAARTEIDFLDTRDGPLAGGPGQDSGKHLETPKTPKYALAYQFDPENMVYGLVSNGFRIGGVNSHIDNVLCGPELGKLGFGSAPQSYNSDRVRNYEIGVKSQPSPRFRFAASVYYIDWFDIIQPVDLVNCGQAFTTNLGKAVSKGADLEATFAPTQQVLLDLMVNYDDAKFTRTIQQPGAPSNIVTSGWTLGQTPWTVVASGEFKFRGLLGWDSYLRGDADFHSRNGGLTSSTDPISASYNPLLRPDPSTLDVRLRYGVRRSTWDASVYIDNVINNHPMLNLQNDSLGGVISYATPVRPLTAGITVVSRF
jgi:outer membrane receptor protein involved in Fe transport